MTKRILTAVVLIPVVLLIVFRAPIWLFATIVAVIAALTTHEYLGIVEAYRIRPYRVPVYLVLVLAFAAAAVLGQNTDPGSYLLGTFFFVAILLGAAVLLFLVVAMHDELHISLPSATVSLLAVPYITLPLVAIVSLRSGVVGWFSVLYLLLVVWAGDICAYFAGRAFGRHKLAPRISPNKTWEGTVASLAGAIVLGLLLFHYYAEIVYGLSRVHLVRDLRDTALYRAPLSLVALLSAAVNIAAQLGDLVESMMKRGAGIKDSGTILPGHGGMLDRIDALLFAAPLLWYIALIAAALGRS